MPPHNVGAGVEVPPLRSYRTGRRLSHRHDLAGCAEPQPQPARAATPVDGVYGIMEELRDGTMRNIIRPARLAASAMFRSPEVAAARLAAIADAVAMEQRARGGGMTGCGIVRTADIPDRPRAKTVEQWGGTVRVLYLYRFPLL